MLLELTNEEARELKQALDSTLGELRDEIAHTDNRSFREMLQGRFHRLEHLSRRLDTSVESDQVYA